jgi:hypothetical protein
MTQSDGRTCRAGAAFIAPSVEAEPPELDSLFQDSREQKNIHVSRLLP